MCSKLQTLRDRWRTARELASEVSCYAVYELGFSTKSFTGVSQIMS